MAAIYRHNRSIDLLYFTAALSNAEICVKMSTYGGRCALLSPTPNSGRRRVYDQFNSIYSPIHDREREFGVNTPERVHGVHTCTKMCILQEEYAYEDVTQ